MIPKVIVVKQVDDLAVVQGFPKITVEQTIPKITVIGTNNMANFLPFSITATSAGQTVFGPLPSYPKAIWAAIIGQLLNQTAGDFTINGLNIVLATGQSIGTIVYGMAEY